MDIKKLNIPARTMMALERSAEIQAILEHYGQWQNPNPDALRNLNGRINQFPIDEQQPLINRMEEIFVEKKRAT